MKPTGIRAVGRRFPLAPIALGTVLYSTGPVLVQASAVSGPVFSFWRLWVGVAVFAVAFGLHGFATGRWPSPRAWRWSLGAGLAFGAHQLVFFTAIKRTSVVDVTLISTLAPLVTALLAVPWFGERPGWPFRLWSLVAMAGATAVVVAGSSGPDGDPLGMGLALVNVVVFTLFFLLSKSSRDHLDVLPFLFGVMTVAAIAVSAYVTLVGEAAGSAGTRDLLYAAIVATGPGFAGHFVMTWPLRWVPANVPPVFRLAIPVLAGLWAWWFLGEAIELAHVIGGALTLAGVAGSVLSPSGRRFVASEARQTSDPTEDRGHSPTSGPTVRDTASHARDDRA